MSAHAQTRVLGPVDYEAFLSLTALDPVVNVFAEHRARLTHLDERWLGGQVWGRFVGRDLVAACHLGANLVPIQCDEGDLAAFAEPILNHRSDTSTIVGPHDSVVALWGLTGERWPKPREERWIQPHLEISSRPLVVPAAEVRLCTPADFDLLYPACVAMHTEELGISPQAGGNPDVYRAHVQRLISKGWSFASFDSAGVTFKAEVVCLTPYAAQVGGVWVRPDCRGQGRAAPGVAAVVSRVIAGSMAPVVSLYVNDWNTRARATYARVGFTQTATLSTLMF